jgi:hypothetical protein
MNSQMTETKSPSDCSSHKTHEPTADHLCGVSLRGVLLCGPLPETAALPTKDGTFLFYIGRVSTDQVAGFGTSVKHPASRAITAPYIKDMFRDLQKKLRKQ